jgi:V/A-type H+-transporting ATPase subunit I
VAIAKLSRVIVACPRSELHILLTRLCQFGLFHPSGREGLVEDVELLQLSSRAHQIYSEATEMLEHIQARGVSVSAAGPARFEARNMVDLMNVLANELLALRPRIQRTGLPEEETRVLVQRLSGVREAASMIFENLRRFRVVPATKRLVITEGFIPTDATESFRRLMRDTLLWVEPVGRSLRGEPYIPSLIINPRVISLFESITLAQGAPRYGEVDPTPIVAFVFPLFFGIMFADLGHGLVLLLAGLALSTREKLSYRYWGRMLILFGVSAMLMGTVAGTIFGVAFPTPFRQLIPLTGLLGGPFTTESALLLMVMAAVIGSFHLAAAYALAVVNHLRTGDLQEALLSHLPTLLLYASAIPLTLSLIATQFRFERIFVSTTPTPVVRELTGLEVPVHLTATVSFPLAAASFATLLLGRPLYYLSRRAKTSKVLEAALQGLLDAILRPVEFLANTISYIRLGVLLILGALLGSSVAELLRQAWPGILLAALANMGIIAIEGLLVYIQDLRLHLYEFFSKFYLGAGTPFTPLHTQGTNCTIQWISNQA